MLLVHLRHKLTLIASLTVDYYINFVMLLVGGFECFAAGWIYGIEIQIDDLSAKIVFTYMVTTFGSVIVACCVWFSTHAAWAGLVALIACYCIGMICVIILMYNKKKEDPYGTWGMMFYGALSLSDQSVCHLYICFLTPRYCSYLSMIRSNHEERSRSFKRPK